LLRETDHDRANLNIMPRPFNLRPRPGARACGAKPGYEPANQLAIQRANYPNH
jgi:hypothetical protein